MSFFIRKGGDGSKNYSTGGRKRKAVHSDKHAKAKKRAEEDEEIDSEGSDIEGRGDAGYESEEDNETPEEKRLRLAKLYLAEVERELSDRKGNKEDLATEVEERLKEDVEEEKGKLRKEFSVNLVGLSSEHVKYWGDKHHKLSITCVVISPDSTRVYSASKDAGIVVWDLHTGEKVFRVAGGRKGQESYHGGHCNTVLALAVSSDGKYLASGDMDKLIHIWDTATMKRVYTFKGHRDSVSGLVFRRGTHTLYSCSFDRSVKIWSVDERAYVETLFGHQDMVCAIDCGARERCVTAGGRDGTARVWKIVEESQLVFNGPQTSLDCIRLLNEEHWVTAGEDGHLAVWGIHKKKPLAVVQHSHGVDQTNKDPNWISALATMHNTDTVVTGSRDGWVRVWKVGEGFRTITEVHKVAVAGFVNSLAISKCGGWVVAGVGQEHKLGRWWTDKVAKNKVVVIKVPGSDPE
eukprot:TRINITY_DN6218_c0_g1_i1.p1 TRINITY_DN6218_c0_g1~~TRINITY_DN6218_c0_g1_i1.p1  ORF type:complete len:463 (-),score=171.61 TRINITY_DN6218_c0_g1_i1:58-1446(-)